MKIALLGLLLALLPWPLGTGKTSDVPPPPAREFRGVWVATVANIDWPSKPGLSTDQQKAELIAILDRAVQLRLNAIILQVRPGCDALYDSRLEPWSEYLTGQMGQAPEPYYDPLAFAVDEAHKRGLELHAWFNPYRAHHAEAKSSLSPDHISQTHPELVRQYGRYLWLDPGEKAVQDYSVSVVRDVVHRYDIDGVHIDDYFYPYKEVDAQKKVIPFPDDASWQKYVASGGKLSRDDWRRANVDTLIQRLYKTIKAEKPWVKFGISPFGIWRPGYPEQIKGFDAYAQLYADSRKWLRNGWVDYWTPQLYWKIDQAPQSYPVLLKWWVEQNARHRNVWPGNFTSRVGGSGTASWGVDEVVQQIHKTRLQPGATGNVHFSMKSFMRSPEGLSETLASGVYALPALVPASPWLGNRAPGKPKFTVALEPGSSGIRLNWLSARNGITWLWVVQTRVGDVWTTEILPGAESSRLLEKDPASPKPDVVAISEVDRLGNQGPPALVRIASLKP
jgi:uncharacterized lipoprotein YddW (UPF0748 family)